MIDMTQIFNRDYHSKANWFGALVLMQLILILMPAIFFFFDVPFVAEICLSIVILGSIYIVTRTRRELIAGSILGRF